MDEDSANRALEAAALIPWPLELEGFNSGADLPYGLTIEHVRLAMIEFLEFLGFINWQLHGRGIARLEAMLMPANFSSIVGEFMGSAIPKHYSGLAKNRHHNGHPDLVPAGMFPGDAVRHADAGIEVKGSRYLRGWQGHNPEDTWLLVFVFDSNRPADPDRGIAPKPFRFVKVVGARLVRADWQFSGRSATSRRTITASVTASGFLKMEANWLYRDPAGAQTAEGGPEPSEEAGL